MYIYIYIIYIYIIYIHYIYIHYIYIHYIYIYIHIYVHSPDFGILGVPMVKWVTWPHCITAPAPRVVPLWLWPPSLVRWLRCLPGPLGAFLQRFCREVIEWVTSVASLKTSGEKLPVCLYKLSTTTNHYVYVNYIYILSIYRWFFH